jgi:hypothetical protein
MGHYEQAIPFLKLAIDEQTTSSDNPIHVGDIMRNSKYF